MSKKTIDVYIYSNKNTPSSRLRWINYKDKFEENGYKIRVKEIKKYVKNKFFLKKNKIEKADYIIIQKTMISNRLLKKFQKQCNHLLYDIDDSIWLKHTSESNALKQNIKYFVKRNLFYKNLEKYDYIISSTEYIKNKIKKYNSNIYIIPTSPSDKNDYENNGKIFMDKFIVGWTGTSSNFIYIEKVEEFLKPFFKKFEDTYLVIISDKKYSSNDKLFNKKIINIPWDKKTEAIYIKNFDIGIMPLEKDEWTLGKAGFKTIYYMKFKIPSISTDWGYQKTFIKNNVNGFLVNNNYEWEEVLTNLYNNNKKRKEIGKNGYKTYVKRFETNVIFEKYLNLLKSLED